MNRTIWTGTALIALGTLALACTAATPLADEEAEIVVPRQEKSDKPAAARPGADEAPSTSADTTAPTCTDECSTPDARRCSAENTAGTEVCSRSEEGCLRWTPGTNCGAELRCDADANDGSCEALPAKPAGTTTSTCTNDSGCSASSVGVEKCSVEGGRGRLTCAKSGSCYKWTSTTACSPDEKCKSGNCVDADACTNACTLNSSRCVVGAARSTQTCVRGATGCTVWVAGQSCSPDETCMSGSCG